MQAPIFLPLKQRDLFATLSLLFFDRYTTMTSPRLSQDEVQHIALIYRLGLSREEIENLRSQLSDIIENFQVLEQVDTTDIPPTGHSVTLENVMRPDKADSPLPKEDILANAPRQRATTFGSRQC